MYIYFFIFISKIIENTLSTLRLIVVANGKKKMGAILNGTVALLWVFSTSIVIVNINKNFFKIFFLCMGAIVGSYLGSLIEEKIALGDSLIICECTKDVYKINNQLNKYVKSVYNYKNFLFIHIQRKKVKKVLSKIDKIDKSSKIIILNIKNID